MSNQQELKSLYKLNIKQIESSATKQEESFFVYKFIKEKLRYSPTNKKILT
jgi:hypothetical protein